jgi:hypothetical protein
VTSLAQSAMITARLTYVSAVHSLHVLGLESFDKKLVEKLS